MKSYFWEMPQRLEYRIKRIWEATEGKFHTKEIENYLMSRYRIIPFKIQGEALPVEMERYAYRSTLQHFRDNYMAWEYGEEWNI